MLQSGLVCLLALRRDRLVMEKRHVAQRIVHLRNVESSINGGEIIPY
jgi:hypothetical protein